MPRLIDADALIADLEHDVELDARALDCLDNESRRDIIQFDKDCKQNAIDLLRKAPTAQPEPHEGHWIGSDGSYICSECNCSPMDFIDTMGASFDAYVETPMNYCPNCGARMKGDTSEAD